MASACVAVVVRNGEISERLYLALAQVQAEVAVIPNNPNNTLVSLGQAGLSILSSRPGGLSAVSSNRHCKRNTDEYRKASALCR